jgi:hypothetical protein
VVRAPSGGRPLAVGPALRLRSRLDAAASQRRDSAAVLVPVLEIGLVEGVYNHVVKNALFLFGAPQRWLLQLFPPPRYELPNDAWFEISGVLQVVPAAFAARAALRLALTLRQSGAVRAASGGT